MDKNNQLIPLTQNNLIPKVANTLSITSKLLAESNRTLVLEIFMKNPILFIELISSYYPLSEVILNQRKNKFSKSLLIINRNIKWTLGFFKKYDFAWFITDTDNPPIPWLTLFNNKYFILNANFENLSSFKSIPWSIELIEKFEDNWAWIPINGYGGFPGLTINKSLPWSIELIEKFEDKWDWDYLSESDFIPWTYELIEKFENKWNWGGLSSNKTIPWTYELIEKYEDKWNWNNISNIFHLIPTSNELTDLFFTKFKYDVIEFEEFEDNKNQAPQLYDEDIYDLAEYFLFELDWNLNLNGHQIIWWGDLKSEYEYFVGVNNELFRINIGKSWSEISKNTIIPWSMELIEQYEYYWNWHFLSRNNSIPLTIELIEKFKNKLDWESMCYNINLTIEIIEKYSAYFKWHFHDNDNIKFMSYIPWTIELIDKYKFTHYRKALSSNKSISWSIELIEKIKYNINWYIFSSNKSLPFTIQLIEKFENNWHWKSLSKNESIPWSTELIEKYKDKWEWQYLSDNNNLPWSIQFINKYVDKLNSSEAIWVTLKQYIDDEMIDEVFNKIENQ